MKSGGSHQDGCFLACETRVASGKLVVHSNADKCVKPDAQESNQRDWCVDDGYYRVNPGSFNKRPKMCKTNVNRCIRWLRKQFNGRQAYVKVRRHRGLAPKYFRSRSSQI